MNENPFSTPAPAEGTNPSVSAAATDLRGAAGDFAKTTSEQATKMKDKTVQAAQALKATAAEKADHYKTVACDKAAQARANAQLQLDATKEKAKELHVTAEEYIRQNPTKAVLGALGVGYIIGLISRR